MTDTPKGSPESASKPPTTPPSHPGETELKLTIDSESVARLLLHPLLKAQRPKRQLLRNTYYDTPDLTLMKGKVAVRERWVGRRCLLTVKTAGVSVGGLSRRLEWEGPTQPGHFDFAKLVTDATMAARLSAMAWQLIPIFRTDFHRRTWLLQHEGASIEIALDEGNIATGGRASEAALLSEPICELELELLSGPATSLRSLALLLMHAPQGKGQEMVPEQGEAKSRHRHRPLPAEPTVALRPEDRSKAQRGLALYTGTRPAPLKVAAQTIDAGVEPREAFALLARDALLQVQANVQGLLHCLDARPDSEPDAEFVHLTRVAIRRLRTALRLFDDALPHRSGKAWRQHWSHMASALGDVRNWDMLRTDWLPLITAHSAWAGVDESSRRAWEEWLHQQTRSSRTAAVAVLRSPAFAHGLLACQQWLDELAEDGARQAAGDDKKKGDAKTKDKDKDKDKGKAATRPTPLIRWSRKAYRDAVQRTLRTARRALRRGPEARHELRLKIKALRYTGEQLSSLLPKPDRREAEVIVNAQTHLGMLNDLDSLQHMLADAPEPARSALLAAAIEHQTEGLGGLPRLERALLKHLPGR